MSRRSPLQLSLFPEPDEEPGPERVTRKTVAGGGGDGVEELRQRLNRHLRRRVASLVVTRNRDRILSVRPHDADRASLVARVDACFLGAPEQIVRALAVWIDGRRGHRQALAELRTYFERSSAADDRPARVPRLPGRSDARGAFFDLQGIFDEINRRYFGDRLEGRVTWSSSPPSARRRKPQSLKLGSYSFRTGVIRIHRALDDVSVPRYVVEAVVFHEMLHAALGEPRVEGGRRLLHPPEFVAAERRFPHYEATERWVRTHLDALLRRARASPPALRAAMKVQR